MMPISLVRLVRAGLGATLCLTLFSTGAWAESARVKEAQASVWGNTTGTAGIIGTVRKGDVLEVLRHEGRWLLVVLPSDPRQRGYVLAQQTESVPDSARPATSATPAAPAAPAAPIVGATQRRPETPAARNARPRVPKPPPYLYLGIVGQASPLDFTGNDSVTTLLESETRSVKYRPSRRPGFELAIGHEMWRNLLISGTLVQTFGPGKAAISAQIPHPIFYATPRPLSGEVTSKRVETALHINIARVVHRSRAYTLTLGVGPSIFFVKQDLLSQVKYDEAYPYDAVTFTGASMDTVSAPAYGADLQIDFVKPFSRTMSWQVTGRYSYGEARLKSGNTTFKSKAGQAQVSGGLHVTF